MPRLQTIKLLRTTKANLDTQASAGNLVVGEPYFITDENRIAIAKTATTYETYVKYTELTSKQDTLVSGTNIKTINSTSILGSGDMTVGGGETANVEALTADKTLTATDAPIQMFTCTASVSVNLPTTGLTVGQKFEIWNINAYSSSLYLNIMQSGSSKYRVISLTKIVLRWNGTNWFSEFTTNISIGDGAYANYSRGVGIGDNASNNYSSGVGIGNGTGSNYTYGVGIGSNATSNSKLANTVAVGAYSRAERNREFMSTSTNSTSNKAQMTIQKYMQKDLSTASAAWQELFIDASSARLTIIASSVYHFRVQLNAIDKTTFDVKTWTLEGSIKSNASNATSIVGTVTKTVTSSDTATTNWDAQVTADDTNEALKIEVKHDSANQVRYSLNIWATETRI